MTEPDPGPDGTSPPPEADPDTLKALAHPLRQRILRQLAVYGPATATGLARDLGENTGATSYHLRQLARQGLVREEPERAHGRERWWRSAGRQLRFARHSQQSPAERLLFEELNRLNYEQDLEMFGRFLAEREELGDWADALPFSRGTLHLTLAELREFFEDYLALLQRYTRPADQHPPDARPVLTRFVAFPAPTRTPAPANSDPDEPQPDDR